MINSNNCFNNAELYNELTSIGEFEKLDSIESLSNAYLSIGGTNASRLKRKIIRRAADIMEGKRKKLLKLASSADETSKPFFKKVLASHLRQLNRKERNFIFWKVERGEETVAYLFPSLHATTAKMNDLKKFEKMAEMCDFCAFEYNMYNQESCDELEKYQKIYQDQFSKNLNMDFDALAKQTKECREESLLPKIAKRNAIIPLPDCDEDSILSEFLAQGKNKIVSLSSAQVHALTATFFTCDTILTPLIVHEVSGLSLQDEGQVQIIEIVQKGDIEKLAKQENKKWSRRPETLKALDSVINTTPLSLVINDRDIMMSQEIDRLVQEKKGIFLAVLGMAHFGGEHGILSLLQKKGYALTKQQF